MSLSVEQVRQMREQIKANDAAKTAAQKKTTTRTAKTTPAAATNMKNTGTGLSVAQVAQIRSQMTAAPASTSRLQTTASTPAWTGGTRQVLGTVSADTLGKQVLADMASNTGSPVATDRQEDYEPDWNYVGSDNAPKQRAIAQGTYGSYAKAAQKVGNALAKDRQTDRFDELNQWMDESPRHREVVDLLRQKEYTTQEDKGVAPEQAVQVTGTKQRYSPGDLLKMGYTAQEINEARAYIREYDALPVTDRAMRRTADTTKGIAATVASAVPMAGEMTTQGAKDIRATQKNEAALDKELEGDARGKELKDRITAVDMDYNPQYTDEDLRDMGYSQSEIDEMRSRIAGTVQKTALDKDTSLGYQLYHYGQQRTEAAQAGMSPAAKTAMGVATSAAENLAVAGVSPYLVLPVLSAQGAAESMGQDVEKGTSAGQAVGVGLAKFGAGWAINSVGVADMARSMGVDYARDTVAGKLADLVRSSKLVSGLGNSQLAANTISGGVDNAVQAFVETYADKIIDATLGGDQQAADELLQSDTFLQALQSGLTGGASGALGGAVGTGLGAMSRTLDARAGTETAAPVQADTESRAADAAAAQRALEERAMEPGEAARQQADQAAAMQQTGNTDAAETTARKDAAPAVRSENSAVQQLAAALQADNLTGKTINLFTPNAANEANRAAFAEEYGMELPATASETRKALRTLARQTRQQAAEAPDTNVGNSAAQMESPAADQHQSAVEKARETVESPAEYADVELRADPAALETDSWTRGEQVQTAQELAQHYRMSTQAVQTVVNNMPAGIGAEIYAPAAASLYRLGVNGEGASFAEALQMTGKGSALSGRVQQVLALGNAGRTALELAYTQGKGEAERYGETKAAELGKQPGKAALRDDAGTYYKADGSVSKGARADDALIELSAKASGVAAQRVVQGLANNAKGLIQSAAGKVFYSGDADAATVMHETLHELNRWDNAGGQELIDTFEHYLVQQNGMDSVQELVQSYLDRYERAGQQLTYNQAMEEITADAMRSIFGTEEDFRNYVRQQAAEARMNAQAQKRSNRVMQKIETLLQKVLTDIKTLLGAEPDNAAAHDAIRPTMESAYDSDWDAAKQELAMDIWNEYLGLPGVANSRNAKLRAEFKVRTQQMNEQARRHSLALQAQANLDAARQRANDRQKMRKGYAEALSQAESKAAKAQQAADARVQKAREQAALAQAKNAERLAKLWDSRDKDNTRRAIRKATGQLTKMFERPTADKYVPEYLLDKVRPVLQLANEAIGNRETAQRLAQWAHRGEEGWTYAPMQDSKAAMEKTMHGLRDGIKREMDNSDRARLAWENSGLQDAIDEWLLDVNDNREREIEVLRAKIENAKQYTREDESPSWTAYVDGLNDRLAALKNGGMATLSSDELRGLRDIIDQTLHIIRTDNVVVGATEDVMIDEFAEGVKLELTDAKGVSKKSGFSGKVSRALNSYKMNTMNIERMFERLGGYTHGGYLENLGKMLNDGQRKKTKILIEGTRVFDELTGPKHEKELYHFTHDLVDIGLKDDSGKARKITHNQLAELALQLQNRQGVHHILHGGLTLENMEAKLSGDTELAKLDKATVRVGQLTVTDEAGNKLDAAALSQNEDAERRTLLEEVDKHLTDYDRAWMAAWKTLNARMTGYINETSMLLSGVKKATTENYIHINVDGDTNLEQNKGIRYDNSAANPGWLNHRVNSSKPILLVGLVQQAETSIENTAQYAGMAVPLRNAEKVLNSMQGGRTLFGTIGDIWGTPAREYMNNALADLCEVKDSRAVGDGVFAKLRSYAAAAALNANINVTLLQAASLPTAAAELGWGATGGAAVQFGKNILPWELTKIEQRMAEHGDELLAYRLRGTGAGEMASAEARKGFAGRTHDAARNSDNKAVRGVTRAADKVISLWTGGITKMDEITVAACWQGSESYVKAHPEEFAAGAEVVNSPEYWAAVNEKFEQVVEHTQPNYTTMQRTGFQRSDNAMVKALMMFSTQRQQNAQILTAAFEDYAAQNEWVKAREKAYREHPGAESKAALEEAQKAKDQAALRKMNAISSQVVQTAVIAALGVGVKFGLHRWQDLQDDNGDMTPWSVAADFVRQFVKSFGSNWTGVSEAMTAVDLATSGFTSTRSTISMNGIEVLNDVVRKIAKVYQLEAKDTSEMTEKQLDAYNAQMKEAIADMLGQFAAARGIPYANLKKQVQAVTGWMDTLANWNKEGGNFDSLPASATGQYDRLYNAYLNGDTVEAKAAIAKLNGMVEAGTIQENKAYEQMGKRLQQYEPRVTEAAKETNADHWEKRKQLVDQMTSELQQAFGGEQSDAHDCVVKAVDAKSNELLKVEKGYDKNSSIYAGLRDAVGSGSGQSVQDEYDRLVKAGKKPDTVKDEITKAAKPDYVDGSDYDREQMAEMLLALTDKDGNALYEQKNLDDWVKQAEKNAEKEAQKENEVDRYDLLK